MHHLLLNGILSLLFKNGKLGVDILARQAVKFLHLCFESNHARVRGQTVSEVSTIRVTSDA